MLTIDYHTYKLHDALFDAEWTIDGIRMAGANEEVKFIVGNGVIKNELLNLLERYGLKPTVQLGNDGVILCDIE